MSDATPQREFYSEPIEPVAGAADAAAMARGEPGLPNRFRWRDRTYEVQELRGRWKTSGRDMGELYLRRHWFDLVTTCGTRMTIYCERQTKNLKKPKQRWWLYTIDRSNSSRDPSAEVDADDRSG